MTNRTPCDGILASVATGGPLRRRQARRHIARCPGCAATTADLQQIIETVSSVPPLTAADRDVWMQAREANRPIVPRRSPIPRLALAALIAAIGAVGLWKTFGPAPTPGAIVRVVDPGLVKQAVLHELDQVGSGLTALSRELHDLDREADLLDARRDVDALGLRFQVALNSNGDRP